MTVKYEIEFYQKENGKVPVFDFLLILNPKMRAKAYREIELLRNHGPELREPYVKPIKGKRNKGIFELRIKFASDITRIFYFCSRNNKFILLHGFIKKSQKTPKGEINKARIYKEDFESRCNNE